LRSIPTVVGQKKEREEGHRRSIGRLSMAKKGERGTDNFLKREEAEREREADNRCVGRQPFKKGKWPMEREEADEKARGKWRWHSLAIDRSVGRSAAQKGERRPLAID